MTQPAEQFAGREVLAQQALANKLQRLELTLVVEADGDFVVYAETGEPEAMARGEVFDGDEIYRGRDSGEAVKAFEARMNLAYRKQGLAPVEQRTLVGAEYGSGESALRTRPQEAQQAHADTLAEVGQPPASPEQSEVPVPARRVRRRKRGNLMSDAQGRVVLNKTAIKRFQRLHAEDCQAMDAAIERARAQRRRFESRPGPWHHDDLCPSCGRIGATPHHRRH